MNSFEQMEAVIAQRRAEPQEGSYTCYLFEKGIDKILKKVGEECAETIIAAKNGDKTELVGEINDVFYHMMVMMNECGVTMEDVCKEMDIRAHEIICFANAQKKGSMYHHFELLEGESFCIGTFRRLFERATVRSCLSAKL